MITFISNVIADYFFEKRLINREEIEICAYGYEVIIFNFFNALLILSLGLIFDILVYSMVFFFIFAILRQYSGGYHAKNMIVCTFVYLISYAFIMFISQCDYISRFYTSSISIILNMSFIGVMLSFAPIENENKKLDNTSKKKYKLISVIITSFLSVISIFAYYINIRISIVISMTVCTVVTMMFVGAYERKEEQHEKVIEPNG